MAKSQSINKARVIQTFSIGDTIILANKGRITIDDIFIVVFPQRGTAKAQLEATYKPVEGDPSSLTCYAEELTDLLLRGNVEDYI